MLFTLLTALAQSPARSEEPHDPDPELCDITGVEWRNSCDRLPELQPYAVLGKLTPGQVSCLQKRVEADDEAVASTRLLHQHALGFGQPDILVESFARMQNLELAVEPFDYLTAAEGQRYRHPQQALGWTEQGLELATDEDAEPFLALRLLIAMDRLSRVDRSTEKRRARRRSIAEAEAAAEGALASWLASEPDHRARQRMDRSVASTGVASWFRSHPAIAVMGNDR